MMWLSWGPGQHSVLQSGAHQELGEASLTYGDPTLQGTATSLANMSQPGWPAFVSAALSSASLNPEISLGGSGCMPPSFCLKQKV